MREKKKKTGIKEHLPEEIEYGKSAFDQHTHPDVPKVTKKVSKASKTGKIIIILIAAILIILIAYIGLNYFYSYELIQQGETTFKPL